MAKLNQLLAIQKTVKAETSGAVTAAYHALQKTPLLAGIARNYAPKDDDGDKLPPESTKVQVRVEAELAKVERALVRLFDVTASIDVTNTDAHAKVVIDGVELTPELPVTTLLFLEKQLTDMHTIVKKLPVLDPSEDWSYNETVDAFSTAPVGTVRTKKIPRNHVKAAATDKHPAQVELYYEDVIVGQWSTVKFSGSVPQHRVNGMVDRVEKLQKAVKFAREEANATTVVDVKIGDTLLDYVLNGM